MLGSGMLYGETYSSPRQSGQAQPSVYEDYNVLKLYLKTCQHLSFTGHSYLEDIILPLIRVMAPSPLQVLIFFFFFVFSPGPWGSEALLGFLAPQLLLSPRGKK